MTFDVHFRAHNLNVPGGDYYFLCDARIQESLSEGERGGGGRPDCRKTTATTLFLIFNPQLILQFCRGVQHFSGGFNFFQGGGGVQMLISIKTHTTCDFPEGSGPPCPPLDPRMFEKSAQVSPSPCHCH